MKEVVTYIASDGKSFLTVSEANEYEAWLKEWTTKNPPLSKRQQEIAEALADIGPGFDYSLRYHHKRTSQHRFTVEKISRLCAEFKSLEPDATSNTPAVEGWSSGPKDHNST